MTDLLYYILCGALTAGVLAGIALMSRMKTAVFGNLLSAVCTAGAILLTLYKYQVLAKWELWLFTVIGLAIGLVWAYRVKMIQMPQMVGLLNGFGGAASAIVAAVSIAGTADAGYFSRATAGLAIAVGMVTFTRSASLFLRPNALCFASATARANTTPKVAMTEYIGKE